MLNLYEQQKKGPGTTAFGYR